MEWFRNIGRFTSGKSQRFALLLAGVLVGLFIGITTLSPAVLAADATWDGSSIEYSGDIYQPIDDTSQVSDLGLPSSGRSYGVSSTGSNGQQEFLVIHFPRINDIGNATNVQHIVYSYTPPNNFSQISKSTLTIEPASNNSSGLSSGSSCNIPGIGWAVCPLSNWLATGMDWFYGSVLTGFLTTQPFSTTDKTSGLYLAWSIMLGIANIMFIILLLVMIYSHITSFGISNYGIKKILPRLIIVAILVNISFYICAIAVDLSNIAGQAIQDMFINIRNTTATVGSSNSADAYTWESVTGAILSGGAAAGAAGASFFMTFSGSSTAASIMLLPLLLGLLVAIIVVMLVLAARQALIVILTIISPLAFVCYLLPGTEKWFGKWRDLFFTMLIFFPAFSAVFGGAQLAGAIIIQNATSIIMAILGLAVQVAPLAIAPLILKLGGGLLNRFAGIVNNPAKGIVDKSKQWAQDRSKVAAANSFRRMQDAQKRREDKIDRNGMRRGRKWHDSLRGTGRRFGRYLDNQSRLLKDRVGEAEKYSENQYHNSDAYGRLDLKNREADLDKTSIEKGLENSWNSSLLSDSRLSEKNIRAKSIGEQSDALSKRVDARYEDFKTGKDHVYTGDMAKVQQDVMSAQEDAFNTDQRISIAKSDQNQRIATKLELNHAETINDAGVSVSYREYAGGIAGESGAAGALANAIAARKKAHSEGIQEARVIQEHFRLTGEERQRLSQAEDVIINDERGSYTFSGSNTDVVEAASLRQIEIGTFSQKMTAILGTNAGNMFDISANGSTQLTGATAEIRTVISDTMASSNIAKTAVFLAGKSIEDTNQGRFTLENAIVQTLAGGKVKDADLSSNDVEALKLMFEFDERNAPEDKRAAFRSGMQSLRESAWRIMNNDELQSNASDAAKKVFAQYAVKPPDRP